MKKVITVLMAVVIICGVFASVMMVNEKRTENNNEVVTINKEVSVDEALINYLNNVDTYYVNGTVDHVSYEVSHKDGSDWIDYFGYENDEIIAVGGIDWNYLESTLNY